MPGDRRLSLAVLQGKDSGRIFLVEKPRVILGRGDADVVLNDTEVSRQHAAIELRDGNSLSRRTGGTTNNQPKVAKCDRSDLNDIFRTSD